MSDGASFLSKIVLPAEITEFERSYLARVNRAAFWFFAAHAPIFALIAAVNDTGPVTALLLTVAVLLGPIIARFGLANPRHVSVVYGITAMLMGGVLVHVGQGPVQIEMHFYFFALLAMLALYGNPMVIIVAAVTVALHHLVLWLYLPRSVFNYEASVWVVGVHALFVVLEAVGSAAIARTFFDNVIGLERIVGERTKELAERNRDVQTLLDNIGQGFLTLDAAGRMSREHSRSVEEWFGAFAPGTAFSSYLAPHAPALAQGLAAAWPAIVRGDRVETAMAAVPKHAEIRGRYFAIDCKPLTGADGRFDRAVLVISDVTEAVERERLEAEQRETAQLVDHVIGDTSTFIERLQQDPNLNRGQRETLMTIYERFMRSKSKAAS